jgi:hypothetical protein
MSEPRRPRIVAAVARLDAAPRKPTRAHRLRQRRQVQAWQRKSNTSSTTKGHSHD